MSNAQLPPPLPMDTGPHVRCYLCGKMCPASETVRMEVEMGRSHHGFAIQGLDDARWGGGTTTHYAMADICCNCERIEREESKRERRRIVIFSLIGVSFLALVLLGMVISIYIILRFYI